MLQFDELRLELEGLRPEIDDLAEALGLERMRNEIAELDTKASMPGFWDDAQNSQKILQRSSSLKDKIAAYEKLTAAYDDTMALIELGNEEGDESLLPEAKDELKNIRESLRHSVFPHCSTESMIIKTPSSLFMQAQVAQRPKTGRKCSIACTAVGESATILR